jgi:hypothetical protein
MSDTDYDHLIDLLSNDVGRFTKDILAFELIQESLPEPAASGLNEIISKHRTILKETKSDLKGLLKKKLTQGATE